MLNKYIFEDKALEKALSKCQKELNLGKEDILYSESYEKGGLLKSDKVIVTVLKKEDIVEAIKTYFKDLSTLIKININTEVLFTNENIRINLNSDNSSALIGKNGKMLNSIQILLRRYLEIETNIPLKINIDIENYKERKVEKLEKNIREIIKEVISTKVDVKLDEMNSYERRIVHNIVSEYENVISESEGIAPHRYVVIKYIER